MYLINNYNTNIDCAMFTIIFSNPKHNRVQGRSYVCDVNGFSFVKNSRKYYDDCALILSEILLMALRSDNKLVPSTSAPICIYHTPANTPHKREMSNKQEVVNSYKDDKVLEELTCVIAIVRHGDRTPKQKIKVTVDDPRYLAYFRDESNSPKKELKVKGKSGLLKFLAVTKDIIVERETAHDKGELTRKLRQIRDVLERWEITGINRKVQLKPTKVEDVLNEQGEVTGHVATELLIILKWGGDLTPLGRDQSEHLGAEFRRNMYPGPEGGGVLRLHATYRHDLKIRSSDEGRVMKTAAAFTKGLLDLEGPLTPILVSLVTVEEKSKQMLDHHGNEEITMETDRCKAHLNALQVDEEVSEDLLRVIAPSCQSSIRTALMRLGNPLRAMRRVHELVSSLCNQVKAYVEKYEGTPDTQLSELESLYSAETFDLMYERWRKLDKDFKKKDTGMYDLTKVPDIYDMVRYDVLHNSHIKLEGMEELYRLSMSIADCVVPQEYGIDKADKRIIGSKTCGVLLEKIKFDLTVAMDDSRMDMRYLLDQSHMDDLAIRSLERCVRTRLYFTSESHLHTILNVLRYPADANACAFSEEGCAALEETPELSYLTQIVIRLFVDKKDANKYRCDISFSPGTYNESDSIAKDVLMEFKSLNKSISAHSLINYLDDAINASK